jgi:hypothetical protein
MGVVTTYPLRVAAKAAQIPTTTYRRWMDTKVVPLRSNDVNPGGSGQYCGLSRARILQAAITAASLKSGVSLSTAAKAALQFTDCGSAGREPGGLFEHGKTVLVIGPEGATIRNVAFDASMADVSHGVCTITVDLNRIVESVDSTLKETR